MEKKIKHQNFLVFSDYEKLGFLLWKVHNYWQRNFKKDLEYLNLTHSQLFLLLKLFHTNTLELKLNQKELAEQAGIDPMTTSTVLRTLQKKGLIDREISEKDSRIMLISISNKGKEIVILAKQAINNFNDEFFKTLKEKNKITDFQNTLILLLGDELNEEEKKNIIIKKQIYNKN